MVHLIIGTIAGSFVFAGILIGLAVILKNK